MDTGLKINQSTDHPYQLLLLVVAEVTNMNLLAFPEDLDLNVSDM